jgi:superkiller protein 3
MTQGKYDEAIYAFDNAVRISDEIIKMSYNIETPTIEERRDIVGVKGTALACKAYVLVYKGDIFASQRKYDEAIHAFDEAIKVSDEALKLDLPLNVDGNARKNVKGLALAKKGRVLALKGFDLTNQNKYDEAIMVLDDAVNASDESLKVGLTLDVHTDVKNSRGFILAVKGVALFSQGKHDESINAFDEAIQLDPTNGGYWNSKGKFLEVLGKSTEADAAFAKAKELGFTG